MNKWLRSAVGSLSVAGLIACAEHSPDWCSPVDAPTHLIGSSPASQARIEPKWKLDGTQPGNELLTPVSAALNPVSGVLALSDFRLAEVILVSTTGTLLRRWARHGSGPGELRIPTALAWADDSRVSVFDPLNQKLLLIGESGEAEDLSVDRRFSSLITSTALSWIQLSPGGTILAQPMPQTHGEAEAEFVVVRGGRPGTGIDTLLRSTIPLARPAGFLPFNAPLWSLPLATSSGDTLLALAGEIPEYRIRVFDREGRILYQICRMVEPLPVADHETGVPFDHPSAAALAAALAETPRPGQLPAIGRLWFDAGARLWVQRDRPSVLSAVDLTLGREGAIFDVYGPDGVYLSEFKAPHRVRILDASGNVVVGLETGELDVLSLVAYAVAW